MFASRGLRSNSTMANASNSQRLDHPRQRRTAQAGLPHLVLARLQRDIGCTSPAGFNDFLIAANHAPSESRGWHATRLQSDSASLHLFCSCLHLPTDPELRGWSSQGFTPAAAIYPVDVEHLPDHDQSGTINNPK